jgi:multiple sugar transport system substrate-binding protein
MAPGEKSLNGRVPASRRSFVKGLSAAGAALSGTAMLPRWSFADDDAAIYANAAIDWKQFSGQTITLAGAIHPWSNAITPLLPHFTKLTGIGVVTDFQLETAFLGALPIKLAGGSRTPDVFMFLTYGQGISAGWLEPLNAYYSDTSLTDLAWYDESDLIKTARGFPLWSDRERYAVPITSEAMTLFINSDALAAKDLPVPRTFDELLATAKAVKTGNMSGIAMRARASGNSSVAAMGFVFSYGGAMVKGNKAVFGSPEAIAAIEMYGQLLRQAGPIGVGSYEWYEVLNDFLQGRTAMAIDSSNFATDISNPAKSPVTN